MPILVIPTNPNEAARAWLAGTPVRTRVPKSANIRAISNLLRNREARPLRIWEANPTLPLGSPIPIYKIKQIANKIVATQRRSLVTKARKNINRGRQERAERILVSRAGLGNSILNKNAISQIAKYLSTRAAHR